MWQEWEPIQSFPIGILPFACLEGVSKCLQSSAEKKYPSLKHLEAKSFSQRLIDGLFTRLADLPFVGLEAYAQLCQEMLLALAPRIWESSQ